MARKQGGGLNIVGYYDEFDLRKVKSGGGFLRKVEKEHDMRHMDFVVYTNKKMSRFRLVIKIQKFMVQSIPEISDQDEYSLYLKINETLAEMTDDQTIFVRIMRTGNKVKGITEDE
jgi:hypothetical protein